ncbi:MAG TPA: helix-turn-helix domain-containing protein [Azospirillaceae bacterium]|nr:helix-turn-helix domain-containing protein [Azospirillaceae bacterium]
MSAALDYQMPSTAVSLLFAFRSRDPQMSVLDAVAFALISENEGLSQTELAELLGEPSYVVSRVVDYLGQGTTQTGRAQRQQGLGLIERVPWDRDRRVRVLRLTQAGRVLRTSLDSLVIRPQTLGR